MKKTWKLILLPVFALLLIGACGKGSKELKEDALQQNTTENNHHEDNVDSIEENSIEEDRVDTGGEITGDAASNAEDSDTADTWPADLEEDNEEEDDVELGGNFKTISDILDYWNALNKKHEEAINEYEGFVTLTLVSAGLGFASGIQYDLLNLDNKDGRYEGELMLAGYDGFIEKAGPNLTFGYEDVLEKDGWDSKAGDKVWESGNCDLEQGYYYSETARERDGTIIYYEVEEFLKEANGDMSCLITTGRRYDARGEESPHTSYLFMRLGEDRYEFVIANTDQGTKYDILRIKEDMTKEKALALFKEAGAAIESKGGIVNGVLVEE